MKYQKTAGLDLRKPGITSTLKRAMGTEYVCCLCPKVMSESPKRSRNTGFQAMRLQYEYNELRVKLCAKSMLRFAGSWLP